jgi:hypothetical protein
MFDAIKPPQVGTLAEPPKSFFVISTGGGTGEPYPQQRTRTVHVNRNGGILSREAQHRDLSTGGAPLFLNLKGLIYDDDQTHKSARLALAANARRAPA